MESSSRAESEALTLLGLLGLGWSLPSAYCCAASAAGSAIPADTSLDTDTAAGCDVLCASRATNEDGWLTGKGRGVSVVLEAEDVLRHSCGMTWQ